MRIVFEFGKTLWFCLSNASRASTFTGNDKTKNVNEKRMFTRVCKGTYRVRFQWLGGRIARRALWSYRCLGRNLRYTAQWFLRQGISDPMDPAPQSSHLVAGKSRWSRFTYVFVFFFALESSFGVDVILVVVVVSCSYSSERAIVVGSSL